MIFSLTKNCNNRLALVLVSIIFLIPFSSYAAEDSQLFQELLNRIAQQLGTNVEVARSFITEVDGMATAIQNNFEKIASDKTNYSEKLRLKRITVREFFSGSNAIVQISSLHRKMLVEKGIDVYLTHLAGLYKKYHTVELKFDKNYFKLGEIKHFYEGRQQGKKYFEFTVDMWQMFIGCYDDFGNNCYKDWTKKGFHMIFKDENPWSYRVKAITVEDTISHDEYEIRKR